MKFTHTPTSCYVHTSHKLINGNIHMYSTKMFGVYSRALETFARAFSGAKWNRFKCIGEDVKEYIFSV